MEISVTLAYLVIMIGGAAFLFIMFLLGGFGDISFDGADVGGDIGDGGDVGGHDGGDVHAESGSDGVHLSPMSPTLIAFAVTAFGAFGLILTLALPGFQVWLVGVIALVSAIVAAGGVFFALVQLLAKAQSTSMYKTSELVGKMAEVTIKIPKDSTGVVDYEIRGQRATSSAKADEDIAQGETVKIKRIVGNIFYVEKMKMGAGSTEE